MICKVIIKGMVHQKMKMIL